MSVTSNNPIPSGPYTITTGATLTITPPETQGNWGWVVLSNSSPFDCSVSVGLPGQWLEAWGYDVFVLQPGNNPITVTAKDDTSNGAVTSGRIKANWYQSNDKPLGSYPGSLTAAAAAAVYQPATADGGSVTLTGGTQFTGVTLPPWAAAVRAYGDPTALTTLQTFYADGVQTSIPYLPNDAGPDLNLPVFPITFPVFGAKDSSVRITITSSGPGGVIYFQVLSESALINSSTWPLSVTITDPTPRAGHTIYHATLTGTGSAAVLAAPTSGYVWEVVGMSVGGDTTAASAISISIYGHTTIAPLITAYATTAGCAANSGARFYCTEGLDLLSNLGGSIVGRGTVVARLVPLAYTTAAG